jgi:hypothetical protein
MTAKERQQAKETRAAELKQFAANLPKRQTNEERQQELEKLRAAQEFIGKELDRLATIEQLNNLYHAPS